MSALFEVSLVPLDKGESIGKYVARCVDVIDKSGLDYQVGSMGTCIEGEWDEVMQVVKQCLEALQQDCHRISISMKVDYREGKSHCLKTKVEHVEGYLGHAVKK